MTAGPSGTCRLLAGDVADLAWVIGAAHQGQGFAAEAAGAMAVWLMDTLAVTTLAASISDDHAASCRVASRIGLMPTEVFDDGERVWIRRAQEP